MTASLAYTDGTISRRKIPWSAETDQTIITMRKQQRGWNDISERTGRTVESCCARYRVLVPKEERQRFRTSVRWSEKDQGALERLISQRKTIPQIVEALGKSRKVIYNKIEYMRRPSRLIFTDLSSRVDVPIAVLEDRERRYAAERDITAVFFGDPAKGFSALDRRGFA